MKEFVALSVKRPTRRIILIGGGGHCRSLLNSMLALNIPVAGILDKNGTKGEKIFGVPILGTDDVLATLSKTDHEVILAVGSVKNNGFRNQLFRKIGRQGFKWATFVARSAVIGREVTIGEGTVVLEGAVINCGVRIGKNCIINSGAILEHGAQIGSSAHIASGAVVGGEVRIGDMGFIGAGSTIIQGINIGPDSAVAAGSVVTKDLPGKVLAAGCPAKIIRP